MGQEATRLDDDRSPLDATAATSGDATTSDDPDAIEQEIEQTRAEMSGTIDAIQEKLDGKPVDWLEHVTAEQYEGRSSLTSHDTRDPRN